MSAFTAADHVTEREPGPWRDCTFASMLETMRLGLTNGRDIPATEAEKERFRAEAGFPDNHTGATIEQTLAVAKRLYGLTEEDFTLTRDWNVLASFLEDAAVVATVTGRMGAFPATVARWDTYTGPHAVAKHDVRVLCDPLAPHGTYIGEEVSLAGWRSFFTGLVDSQAFVMRVTEAGGAMLTLPEGITSPQRVRIVKKGDLTDEAGARVASVPVGRTFPYLGTRPGHKAVLVRTAIPYADGQERPTMLYVTSDMVAPPENAKPDPTPSTKPVAVVLTVGGTTEFSRTF